MTQNRQSTRFFSKLQENHVANIINGRCTPNSGATPYIKGDVCSSGTDDNSWLLECKTSMTNKQSFSIKKEWLRTLRNDAIQQGKMNYALVFNFGPNTDNYYVLSESKFKELFGESNT